MREFLINVWKFQSVWYCRTVVSLYFQVLYMYVHCRTVIFAPNILPFVYLFAELRDDMQTAVKILQTIVEKTAQKCEKIWFVLGPILTEAVSKVRIRKRNFVFYVTIQYLNYIAEDLTPRVFFLQLVRASVHTGIRNRVILSSRGSIHSPWLGG